MDCFSKVSNVGGMENDEMTAVTLSFPNTYNRMANKEYKTSQTYISKLALDTKDRV